MDKLEIYNQLKEEIIDLKIEPGALISENEISRRFEVSRTPVRDVFLRLCNDGLLEVLPQRGTKVSLIDMELVMADGKRIQTLGHCFSLSLNRF